MADRADVVVVGAGPTGLVTAGSLARAGHSVILVDRGGEPRPGPVFVDGPALQLFDDLGWTDVVEGMSSAARHAELEVIGEHERHSLDDGWDMWMAPRRPLIEAMRRRASRDGVTWIAGLSAVVPVWTDRRVTGVRTRDGRGGERQFDGRLVIDASGPDAFLATALGLRLPRRGDPRPRVAARLVGDGAPLRHTLALVRGGWMVGGRVGDVTAVSGVMRPRADHQAIDDAAVIGALGGDVEDVAQVHRSVGAALLAHAGDGWVAVGEAAGCGAPGSPGVTSAGLRLAASAAWEADLALSRHRAPSTGMFGVTVTMSRRDAQLGPMLDRALMRASRTGVLSWAFDTAWRRRRLRDVLRGEWSPDARFGRGWFLWRLDRISRRAARSEGSG